MNEISTSEKINHAYLNIQQMNIQLDERNAGLVYDSLRKLRESYAEIKKMEEEVKHLRKENAKEAEEQGEAEETKKGAEG